jgi:hypothetical protein
MKIPFFIAKGNHDSKQYFEKNAYPLFSQQSKTKIATSYYSFNRVNCHFIMLDCTAEKLEDQLTWLEKDLGTASTNPEIDHIFVAGHYPLWIVARAGFTRKDYAIPVSSLLAKYRVDAYFCGHTHNKTVTVRIINGQPLTQIMDAAVVEEGRLFNLAPYLHHTRPEPENPESPGILPLEEGHQVFIPGSELLYYWGYQEGSTTSYNVITVNKKNVRVDWHVLGEGIIRSYTWNEPGKLIDLKIPVQKVSIPLTEGDLNKIEKAWLYAAPWTLEDSILAPISINGKSCGILNMSKARMAYSPFWNKIEVPLNVDAKSIIKKENEILLTNPGKVKFGLAHIFILVKFSDGRFAKSSLSQKIITSFQPEEGQQNFPAAELIDPVDLGKPLAKVVLRFDSFCVNGFN